MAGLHVQKSSHCNENLQKDDQLQNKLEKHFIIAGQLWVKCVHVSPKNRADEEVSIAVGVDNKCDELVRGTLNENTAPLGLLECCWL